MIDIVGKRRGGRERERERERERARERERECRIGINLMSQHLSELREDGRERERMSEQLRSAFRTTKDQERERQR